SGRRSRASSGTMNDTPVGLRFLGFRAPRPAVRRAWACSRALGYHSGAGRQRDAAAKGVLPMTTKFRITSATMSADNEELQAADDAAAERARAELGKDYPVVVNGEERWRDDTYDEPSPIDKDILIGRFSQATTQDVDDAVAAAKGFWLEWE